MSHNKDSIFHKALRLWASLAVSSSHKASGSLALGAFLNSYFLDVAASGSESSADVEQGLGSYRIVGCKGADLRDLGFLVSGHL